MESGAAELGPMQQLRGLEIGNVLQQSTWAFWMGTPCKKRRKK